MDLYHEKSGILDDADDREVDLNSEAFQVWKNAMDTNPELEKIIKNLPNVIYSTREHQQTELDPEGVLMYLRTADGTDALAWINQEGKSVTQSQMRKLKSGMNDEQLATMIISLRDNNSLCVIHSEDRQQEAQIICLLGLFKGC